MSRQTRIEYEGAWYHVVNRGAGRQRVFRTDSQRRYFLSLLGETAERFKAEWHAYCLMGNHCHLMVRTPEGNLQRIMRHVNGLYTQYFNRSARRDGTLFRGRYKAVLVDVEAYWLELSRYIHRNPLEAGLVEDLASYRWSSYRAYCGLEKPPEWLTTGFILNARGQRDRHRRYAAFVAEGTADALVTFYRKAKLSPILGNDEFRTRVLGRRAMHIDMPELKRARALPSLEEIVVATARRFGVTETAVWTSRRGRAVISPARSAAMYLCQRVGDMRLGEIADAFGLAGYASAGSTIRQIKGRKDKPSNQINYILLDLTPYIH
jgi:REP element-mobilizing transposase RayT